MWVPMTISILSIGGLNLVYLLFSNPYFFAFVTEKKKKWKHIQITFEHTTLIR